MSKKKNQRLKRSVIHRSNRRRYYIGLAASGLMVALCLGVVMGPWSNSLGARRVRSIFTSPPPVIPAAGNPSKEYIYAGGKLVATEEPQPLAAPAGLIASTFSVSRIDITWTASAGADHYVVERAPTVTAGYAAVASSVTDPAFSDTTVASGVTYLYRVRAINSSGASSAPSNVNPATAITFADDPITAGTTHIKAQHLTELRQAVDAVRVAANLGGATWSDSAPTGVLIKAIHIQELRTNLDQALSVLGVPLEPYTDPSLSGTTVKQAHIAEIRQRVK
jgi:fibronectin type 3 domain-containing protein